MKIIRSGPKCVIIRLLDAGVIFVFFLFNKPLVVISDRTSPVQQTWVKSSQYELFQFIKLEYETFLKREDMSDHPSQCTSVGMWRECENECRVSSLYRMSFIEIIPPFDDARDAP